MNKKVKKIVILGDKGTEKSSLFNLLFKKYKKADDHFSLRTYPLINYSERDISISGNNYKIFDTPFFDFANRKEKIRNLVAYESKRIIEELVESCDLVIWVSGIDEKKRDRYYEAKKFFGKKKKKFLYIESNFNDISDEIIPKKLERDALCLSHFSEKELEKLASRIVELLPVSNYDSTDSLNSLNEKVNLLIFGPPNSGKSTLMNSVLRIKRSVVTEIEGTTNEPVISNLTREKTSFNLIDTAGITKNKKLEKIVWSNCDIAWSVIDGSKEITKQILQIINLSEKNQKPLIIIINKSDIIKEKEKIEDELRRRLKSLSFCPIIYISALKSRKIRELIKLTDEILISSKLSFGKKELNLAISKMSKKNSPNFWNGGKLKIYYAKHEVGMTQKFIVFVNNVNFLHFSYQRYVSNFFRREFNIKYNPIKVFFKNST